MDASVMVMLTPVLTPHGLLTLAAYGRSRGSRHWSLSGARGWSRRLRGAGTWPVVPGRRRGRDGAASRAVVLARARDALRDRTVRLPGIGEGGSKPPVPIPADGELDKMAAAVPPMTGAEYLTTAVLANLWRDMDRPSMPSWRKPSSPCRSSSKSRHPAWNLVGRVHFNLAENRKDEDAPFAFLATYTTRLSAEAKAQHLPLGKALQEYGGARNRERLLSLLMPVQRAAEHCSWLKAMVDAGEIFHPLRWSPQQALQFLKDVPALEGAGVVVRMPASWRMNRPARPQVKATVGGNSPSQLGMDALLDFRMEVTLDGESLSAAEIKRLLAQSDGLALIRGKWVEVDHERLSRTLEQFEAIERRAVSRWPVVRRGDAHAGRSRHRRTVGPPGKPTMTGARPWPVLGWRRRSRLCAIPTGLRASTRSITFRAHCGPISRRACNGSICSHSSGLGPALPTTWGSARRSRSCRCCWC